MAKRKKPPRLEGLHRITQTDLGPAEKGTKACGDLSEEFSGRKRSGSNTCDDMKRQKCDRLWGDLGDSSDGVIQNVMSVEISIASFLNCEPRNSNTRVTPVCLPQTRQHLQTCKSHPFFRVHDRKKQNT